MREEVTVLGLIPARSGSKGLPGKNLRMLAGRPLIAWTIDAALDSKSISRLVVTTDSAEIARVAEALGADVPFTRPTQLAADGTSMFEVVKHALDCIHSEQAIEYDVLVLLQPTSPLRTGRHIDEAVRLLLDRDVGSVISVCKAEHSPLRAGRLSQDMSMRDFMRPEYTNANRQEMPTYYRLNGAVYAARVDYVIRNGGFFGNDTIAYVMPQEVSVDIDTQLDLIVAEAIMTAEPEGGP